MINIEEERSKCTPLLVDANSLAALLGVALRHVRRLDACGLLPQAVRLDRAKRWLAEMILEWLQAGSPPRQQFEVMQRGRGRGPQ